MKPQASSALPASVKIGWCTYRIEQWDTREAVAANRYGETCHTTSKIRVDTGYGTQQAASTLLHEIMHAVSAIWAMDDEDGEERTVKIMQHGLSTVWRDNPEVMAWIGQHLQHGT
ncbi:MAG: hypothetical protein KGL39_41595 [Patescibacteria group bacterium]|nr:hypothetical protein [Patescibacteria group bacterium]